MAETEMLDSVRILLIEDDGEFAEMYRIRLEADEYVVEWGPDGRQGLERARSWDPDLILLDVRMPDMDGLEVLRALREDPVTFDVPVVMLTNYSDEGMRREAERLGIVQWQSKVGTTPGAIADWIERWSSGLEAEGRSRPTEVDFA